jgi:hypothetical protein
MLTSDRKQAIDFFGAGKKLPGRKEFLLPVSLVKDMGKIPGIKRLIGFWSFGAGKC